MGFIQHQNPGIPASLLTPQQLLLQQQLALQQQQNAAGVPVQLLQGARGIPQPYAEASLEAYNIQAQKNAIEQARRQQYAASGLPYQAMAFPPQLSNPSLMAARPNVQQLYQQMAQSRQVAALQHQMDLKNKKK